MARTPTGSRCWRPTTGVAASPAAARKPPDRADLESHARRRRPVQPGAARRRALRDLPRRPALCVRRRNGRERWRYQAAGGDPLRPPPSPATSCSSAPTTGRCRRRSGIGQRRWQVEGAGEVWASPTVSSTTTSISAAPAATSPRSIAAPASGGGAAAGRAHLVDPVRHRSAALPRLQRRPPHGPRSRHRARTSGLIAPPTAWLRRRRSTADWCWSDRRITSSTRSTCQSGTVRWKVETGLGVTSSARLSPAARSSSAAATATSMPCPSPTAARSGNRGRCGPSRGAAAGRRGFVCIQTFYGTTQAFETDTGKELWRANLGGSVRSTPVVSADAVYLATYPGVVYALR